MCEADNGFGDPSTTVLKLDVQREFSSPFFTFLHHFIFLLESGTDGGKGKRGREFEGKRGEEGRKGSLRGREEVASPKRSIRREKH
jgi:hypothetical protein